MPMPHQTFSQLIRRRLVGKEGKARLKVLQEALQELPNYKNGPYADLRKWVNEEIDRTRVRACDHRRRGTGRAGRGAGARPVRGAIRPH